MVENIENLNSLDEWFKQWATQFSATISAVLAYKCRVLPGRPFINGLLIITTQCEKYLRFQYSISFDIHEQTFCQIAKANKTNGLIVATFRTLKCKLILYKSHGIPQSEYCSLIFSSMLRVDRVALEEAQRALAKKHVGPTSILNFRERCELL